MLNIMVVDDEERIRLGLAKLIELSGDEFRVIGIYENALELLEHLEEEEPDLVVTDIKMPQMDGLRLIERIRERKPSVSIAIISGFSEFDYARQAIRLGVEEYLLKPVDTDELNALLERVRLKRIRERSQQITAKDDYIRLLAINGPDKLTDALKAEAEAALTEHPLFRDYYACFVLRASADRIQERIRSWSSGLNRETRVLSWELNETVLLVSIRPDDNTETIRSLGAGLLANLPVNVHVRAGTSGIYSSPLALNESYHEALTALHYAWYEEGIRVLASADKLAKRADEASSTLHRLIDRDFRSALHTLDSERAEAAIKTWIHEAGQTHLPWTLLNEHSALLQTLVRDEKAERGFSQEEETEAIYPAGYADWHEFGRALLQFVQEQTKLLSELQQDNRIIETVKGYIQEHYTEEIELSKLAELVFLTPSYLSKLFRVKTGETITDLIISLRIEQAKRLLATELSLKTYEVGERVGYADPAYFNKVFKKIAGLTPKEYRDRVRI
ncbi:response regulator [Gorillibacterium sp. sgz500922]|uniref:response regulator n=1 Tax=Gorillibacterium sp. sgz500922 TaxID=3446694 RepID=UPI003F679567